MNTQCRLVILIFVLTLDDQVRAGKITGGREAVPHSRPYMALLERMLQDGSKIYCSGFLLNEDFVMTAAHCDAKSYTVILGLHNVKKTARDVQKVLVERKFPSKYYNQTGFINDIMLLKLSSKAIFTETVRPITLASKEDVTLPKSCSISGWGATETSEGYMSDVLMEANVTLINIKGCSGQKLYCAEGNGGPGCGDSGGPLVCEDGKAYGVVSQTIVGPPRRYTFAKIPDHKHWIVSTMKNIGKL